MASGLCWLTLQKTFTMGKVCIPCTCIYFMKRSKYFDTFSTPPKKNTHSIFGCSFLPRTACRRDTPWTSATRTKLAENLWNTFKRLRATWISVEPRSLLVTRHDPSTFRKIGSKNATNFWNCCVWLVRSTVGESESSLNRGKMSHKLFLINSSFY